MRLALIILAYCAALHQIAEAWNTFCYSKTHGASGEIEELHGGCGFDTGQDHYCDVAWVDKKGA